MACHPFYDAADFPLGEPKELINEEIDFSPGCLVSGDYLFGQLQQLLLHRQRNFRQGQGFSG